MVSLGEPGHDENVKSYLVPGRDLALLFDTGTGIADIHEVIQSLVSTSVLVVNSHAHWDHVGGDQGFERIWIHAAEADNLERGVPNERLRVLAAPERFTAPPPEGFDLETFSIPGSTPERVLHEGDLIDLGDRQFSVVHTPGHSPGGITLIDGVTGTALVGDAVYAGTLYAHLPGGDPVVYRETLRKLAELAPSLRTVYPSHNDYPLAPGFLLDVHRGFEEIWSGRQADARRPGVEEYRSSSFSVLLPEGWRG